MRALVATSVPGAKVTVESGGRMTITSPPGTDNEVTGLSLSTGGAAPLFDTAFASSTQTQAASGIGSFQADDTLHFQTDPNGHRMAMFRSRKTRTLGAFE